MNNTIQLHCDLTLACDPMEKGPTSNGQPMAVAFANLKLSVREQGRNDETELVNISLVAFGDNAGRLLRYKKGDHCYVIGTLGFTRWKPNGSAEPEQRFQLVIDGISDECPMPDKPTHQKRKPWETPGGMSQTPKGSDQFFAKLAAKNDEEPPS